MPVFTGMTYHKLNFIHEIHSSFTICVLYFKILDFQLESEKVFSFGEKIVMRGKNIDY